jgi:hypothetical protein
MHSFNKKILLFLLVFISFTAGPALAANYNLCTGQADLTMPDGAVIPVWGFGIDTGANPCSISVPGPELVVPSNDQVLRVTLRNTLNEPVSLHIVGQSLSNDTGPRYDRMNRSNRVRSFTMETSPGTTRVYRWGSFKPGTYLLQSGTNPAKQVQMGLYAPVKKNASATEAYAGVPYDRELTLVFHEIDPEIHAAIAQNRYGYNPSSPTGPYITSSVHHKPAYFLINGKTHPDPLLDPVIQVSRGNRVLLRFINAGLKTHVPQVLGPYMTLVAEDGIPCSYTKEQHGIELPPAKSIDAILQPAAAGKIPIYDARLNLTNAGTAPGGMLAYLDVSAPPPADTVTITNAAYQVNNTLRIWATSDAPVGTVTMTAEVQFQTGSAVLGILPYRAATGDYRMAFNNVTPQPVSVTVISSQGGSTNSAVTAQ